ncbi:MAG: Y-family DNA polymerase, partial [Thermoplasmata archaeon]
MGDDARPSAILALGRRSVPPPRHGWIAYVDMDAFYVSCEIRDRPELADRPVIVGREPTGPATRGVVLSASYPARRSGVHSAMPVLLAARRCPEAIWIAPDFPKYTRISGEIRDYLDRWSGRVVPLSIDEAALEIDRPNPESVAAWARELTSGLAAELRMPASVGASRSAVVAKIACDAAKPGGIRVVAPEETEAFLAPKPVGAIPGIGPKTAERLAGVGVGVIGELARASPESLRAI